MNFAAFNCLQMPGNLSAVIALAALIMVLLSAPARGQACATDGQTPGMRRSCTAVAASSNPAPIRSCVARPAFDAREGVALSEVSVSSVTGVNAAGASRGRGTGNLTFPSACSSAGRTVAPTAQQADASTKEHSAVTNRRRISAAQYMNTAAAGHTAAAPTFQEPRRA